MNLQIISDVHCESHKDGGLSFINSLDSTDIDALIIAGDLDNFNHAHPAINVLKLFRKKYNKIFFVHGNHDLWYTSPKAAIKNIENICLDNDIEFLRAGKIVEFMGHRFLGDAMFFPEAPDNPSLEYAMSDFEKIKEFKPWLYGHNYAFYHFIKNNMKEGDIVITHHLPSFKSVHPKYKRSSLNTFFVSEMDELILALKPRLWVHGHTHSSADYNLGSTRIVANPFGDPARFLNKDFQDKLIITL